MASFSNSYASLQAQFERAKENLKDVDENIKKLIGRDPTEIRVNVPRRMPGGPMDRGRPADRSSIIIRRDLSLGDGPPMKRRNVGGAFSRLGPKPVRRIRGEDSPDEDEDSTKHTVQSSIVAAQKEVKNRKEIMDQQKADSKGMARNKRMFGLLLGTLQRFKDDEQKKKQQVDKRQEIEKKLELAAEKEKEEVKKAKQELFLERRKRQADLRKLEQKVDLVKQFEEWEASEKHLVNFIKTKAIPPIYYLPKRMTPKHQQKLKECKRAIEIELLQRKAKLLDELNELDMVKEDAAANQAMNANDMEEGEIGSENVPPAGTVEVGGADVAQQDDVDSAFAAAEASSVQFETAQFEVAFDADSNNVVESVANMDESTHNENDRPPEVGEESNQQNGLNVEEAKAAEMETEESTTFLQQIMLPSDSIAQETEFEPIYD